ncbi:SIMPL domain-containing protein [Jeongeupia wiesaeckerbachi]|uniref:SIMPL domain-containing protein n=1 Tax=Jeongeupia wiesaeckerbachi TaxID=3051218 RepID=UPI003D80A2E2
MRRIAACLLLAGLSGPVLAETLNYNVVNLNAQSSREVGNDTAHALLYVELSDSDPARLADKVNQTLAAAVKRVKSVGSVQSGGTGYTTFPIYNSKTNKQEGWRGRGELRLNSKDFSALSKLLGELQQPLANGIGMQLADVRYGVSEQRRDQVENELIEESLKAFRQRADLVRRNLDGSGFKVINVNVDTGQSVQPPMPMYKSARAMSADAVGAAPPMLEGGDSRVSVTVSGSIQVQQ